MANKKNTTEKKDNELKKKKSEILQDENKKTMYFGFMSRLIFDIVAFLILLVTGTLLLNNSLRFEGQQVIKYDEKSNLDYRVYLRENEFYEDKYLGKDMLYVASLIDKVQIDFDYLFKTDDKESIDFNYNIIGKLSITNVTGTKSYYEKTYILLDSKDKQMRNSNAQRITEKIDIDYGYYNSLANKFKMSYGVDTESKLTVYMIINKKNTEESNFTLDNNSIMNVTIPLSEKSVDIKMDYREINETSSIIKNENISIKNIILLGLSVILIGLSLIMMIRGMRKINLLHTRKSAYDKYISKLLKEYDRLIAETETLISFKDKEIIKINKFTELLDIHDNLQLPIMYYVINKHQKCYFYINHDKIIYLLTIKAVDLEKK